MGKHTAPQQSTTTTDAPKKSVTPPKGRPTRARNGSGRRQGAFGPVAQWIAVALLVALILVVLILVTDGGDFNPFNDDDPPSQFGAAASLEVT